MKKITTSLILKITAFFLVTVTFALTLISAVGIVALLEIGAYEYSEDFVLRDYTESYLYSEGYSLANRYHDSGVALTPGLQTNYYYQISDADGQILETNFNGEDYFVKVQTRLSFRTYVSPEESYTDFFLYGEEEEAKLEVPEVDYGKYIVEEYHITLWSKTELVVQDRLYLFNTVYDLAYSLRYWAFVFLLVFGVSTLILMIFLYCSAGHRKEAEKPQLNYLDRIPFDLYSLFFFALAFLEIALFSENGLWFLPTLYAVAFLFVVAVVDFLLFMAYTLSFATRVKTGTLFKNTVLRHVFHWLGKGVKAVWSGITWVASNLPLIWKACIWLFVLVLFQLLLGIFTENIVAFSALAMEMFIFVPFVIYYAIQLQKLQKAGEEISKGDLNYRVQTDNMTPNLKKHAENLNSISLGMSRAVEERLKSERFKTELITNVSHDIKTPLTSIINYVNLLQKEDLQNERARQYLEVLDRQSNRLKKLVVDLVEASKASSGAIKVEFAPCEVNILLQQAVGEYQEKFQNAALEVVLTLPEEPIVILADGRHLWRVFDNLMNNIAKYAQSGTRVYLSLEHRENRVFISFRNISRAPLNIPGEELMERFVRGDSSRNTEGSGLGLSIARSLVELQNGILTLVVDGDLFKVVLSFEAFQSPSLPQ